LRNQSYYSSFWHYCGDRIFPARAPLAASSRSIGVILAMPPAATGALREIVLSFGRRATLACRIVLGGTDMMPIVLYARVLQSSIAYWQALTVFQKQLLMSLSHQAVPEAAGATPSATASATPEDTAPRERRRAGA
jgi:hypothetical protein